MRTTEAFFALDRHTLYAKMLSERSYAAMRVVGLALCAWLAAAVAHAAPSQPLTLMTWGGVWQKTFQELAADYKAQTGQEVRIVAQSSADAGLARLIAQKARPEIDLWTPNMVNYSRAVPAGVLAPIARLGLDKAPDVPSDLKLSHAIGAWISQRGIFYRKDLVPFAPKKWEDLWDERFKGKLAAPSATFDPGYFPLMAAVINGGSIQNIDPGFVALARLKPNIATFFTNNVQSIRLLEAGEVAAVAWGVLPNVISYLGRDSKYGFVIPAPGFHAETPIAVVAGSPNTDAAAAFIKYILTPGPQAKLATALGSAPANEKVPVSDVIKATGFDPKKSYHVDYGALAEKLGSVMDRYDREIMAR